MNKFVYLFVYTLFCGSLFADNFKNQTLDVLEETLVPKNKILDRESLEAGMPIYASEVSISKHGSGSDTTRRCCHIGHYIGGYIETRIYDVAMDKDGNTTKEFYPVGYQKVTDPSTQTISETITWEVETILGKTYVVHYHKNFCVYSSPDTQCVIPN